MSRSKIRLKSRSPFLGTLTYFSSFELDPGVPTAETDGQNVWVSPELARELPPSQLDGLVLHEVLHAALLHCSRRGERRPLRWNVAADIIVNGIVAQQEGLDLPPGGVREPNLEDRSVEEVYVLLGKAEYSGLTNQLRDRWRDLRKRQAEANRAPGVPQGKDLRAHWKQALRQAKSAKQLSSSGGDLPARIQRHVNEILTPQIDWQSMLWRHLVKTHADYSGFDRRFVHRGLYLEGLRTDALHVYVGMDTSASIHSEVLEQFMSEIRAISRAYEHVEIRLWYTDSEIHGPYELNSGLVLPNPKGGGGTSFIPFFEEIQGRASTEGKMACVYLTDGYGDFPGDALQRDVLWAVSPGGLASEEFPFGRVVRLTERSV